jgi:hypothetical protein
MSIQFTREQLASLREGRRRLAPEEQAVFLEAVIGLVDVLAHAPRGADVAQLAIWNRHERQPALDALAAALGAPREDSAQGGMTDAEAVRALLATIRKP